MKGKISKQTYVTGALAAGLSAVAAAKLYKTFTRSKKKVEEMIKENDEPSEETLDSLRKLFKDDDIDGYKNILFFNVKFKVYTFVFCITIVLKKGNLFGSCVKKIGTVDSTPTEKILKHITMEQLFRENLKWIMKDAVIRIMMDGIDIESATHKHDKKEKENKNEEQEEDAGFSWASYFWLSGAFIKNLFTEGRPNRVESVIEVGVCSKNVTVKLDTSQNMAKVNLLANNKHPIQANATLTLRKEDKHTLKIKYSSDTEQDTFDTLTITIQKNEEGVYEAKNEANKVVDMVDAELILRASKSFINGLKLSAYKSGNK